MYFLTRLFIHGSTRASRFAIALVALPIVLSACGGDDDDPQPTLAEYRITITNTTHEQPLSPVAAILHDDDYRAWAIGSAASIGLEDLAESGSPTAFLNEADDAQDSTQADAVLAPGDQISLEVSAVYRSDLAITLASMLVNTNDAFTGTTGLSVGHLARGESLSLLAPVYDAGTEANSETAASVPGPAAGGEGFNATREARDQVTRHPGVVTQDDGYEASALSQAHRFDNGAMHVLIERSL